MCILYKAVRNIRTHVISLHLLTIDGDGPRGTWLSILILNHTHKRSTILPKYTGDVQLSCCSRGEPTGREHLAILAKPANSSLRKVEAS